MRTCTSFFLVLFFLCRGAIAQAPQRTEAKGPAIETGLLFTLAYNSASIGFSFQGAGRLEHVFLLNGTVMLIPPSTSIAGRYSLNIQHKKLRRMSTYLPLWASVRDAKFFPYEESYGDEYLLGTLGTGYGMKWLFKNGHKLRVELGAGASLIARTRHLNDKITEKNFTLNSSQPVIPALRFSIKYVIPLVRQL